MEQIDGNQRRLSIVREDVDVFTFGGRHFLLLRHFANSRYQVAEICRFLNAHLLGSGLHPLFEFAEQVVVPAFEKQPDVLYSGAISLVGRQRLHAWPETSMDVVLQARMGMLPAEIDLTGRHLELPVDEMYEAMRQISGEIRSVITRTVFDNPARDVNT